MHWAKSIEFNLERTLHYIKAAAEYGSRVVLFPEANLTSYYFPYAVKLDPAKTRNALDRTCEAARKNNIWVIVGSIEKTSDRYLNLAHVINPQGTIVHEYAKVNMAGSDEKKYCRGGNKLSLFEIDGILCTLVICRDGRHPELYRIPAMAGAQILFHPSCSSDSIEAVAWKRTSGRAEHKNISLRRQHYWPVTGRKADFQRRVIHPRTCRPSVGRSRILPGKDDYRRPGYRSRRQVVYFGLYGTSPLPEKILA